MVLTLLAPAARCNQKCPECIIDLAREPTRTFALTPDDYARTVEQFTSAKVPILAVSFQGYEVTLPQSWPYVEAVFAAVQKKRIDRGFVTNGMLLHKWTDRIVALDPSRIAISLDGSEPATHDPIRGLAGAFDSTLRSVERFLARAPDFRDRLVVASTVNVETNYRSLRRMPTVLRSLGIRRWALSAELCVVDGRKRPKNSPKRTVSALCSLVELGVREGVKTHVNDELGRFAQERRRDPSVFKALYHPSFLVRVEPAGFVRVGHEVTEVFDPRRARRFDPKVDDIVEVMGYLESEARLRQAMGSKGTVTFGNYIR